MLMDLPEISTSPRATISEKRTGNIAKRRLLVNPDAPEIQTEFVTIQAVSALELHSARQVKKIRVGTGREGAVRISVSLVFRLQSASCRSEPWVAKRLESKIQSASSIRTGAWVWLESSCISRRATTRVARTLG